MCGIVGYVGKSKKINFLLNTLKQLEYRGYDSCGIAVNKGKSIFCKKVKGKINGLKGKVDLNMGFSLGIAHTRWATHGIPNHENSHPHFDCNKEIFVVHNGIIENYNDLKMSLISKGHKIISQTDTEIIAHLIEEFSKKLAPFKAFLKAINTLKGSFAIAVVKKGDNKLFFAKQDSPLVVGVSREGFVIASDTTAIVETTKKIINIKDGSAGYIDKSGCNLFNLKGKKIKTKIETTNLSVRKSTKKNYKHFMMKEIFEQPKVLSNLFSLHVKKGKPDFKNLGISDAYLKSMKKVFIFACGTAYHAGFVAKGLLEKYCGVDVEIDVSSEARYRYLNLTKKDLVIAISQSGETADTLAAVKQAKIRGAKIIGVCNVLGSTLTKESDGLIYTCAGPEIGVASTKAYTAQVFSLFLFSLYIAQIKNALSKKEIGNFLKELNKVPAYQQIILDRSAQIKSIANHFAKFGCFLFLGRGLHYPSALEGALKLKEISYIPAEGYPAGEMKHGPIALIDEYRAVVCIVLKDVLYPKMISNIQEIKARKGKVLAIVSHHDKEATALADEIIVIPSLKIQDISPLIVAPPLQLFAYFVAQKLGCEIDQPRNLAKSVTVE